MLGFQILSTISTYTCVHQVAPAPWCPGVQEKGQLEEAVTGAAVGVMMMDVDDLSSQEETRRYPALY